MTIDQPMVAAFLAVLGGTSLLAVTARWFGRTDELPSLESWALADRRFGGLVTWFLLGGSIYTAYTFAAVPGLVYDAGAVGFFALPYTVIVYPLAFVLLPRMWRAARDHGSITIADYVKARYGSAALGLMVALTGILATMPYIALQLVGIRAVLSACGLYPEGWRGDLVLIAVFAVLAVATFRHGLRAPAVISLAKGAAIFGAVIGVVVAVLDRLGGTGRMFEAAARNPEGHPPLLLSPDMYPAFATLALGSALALLMYPHVTTAAFAASSAPTLRKVSIALPGWTAVLGLFGMLGIAALAAGVDAPSGTAEAAVPLLVKELMPSALTGVLLGALVVGALVPAAVMSIAAAALFVRNIYVEYFQPYATPKYQARVAQWISLIAKVGAVAFILGLRNRDAINLQLLGGVWILQTFPAVALGLFTRWRDARALLAGWAAGMASGTLMVVWGGFSALVTVRAFGVAFPAYAAVVALVVNAAVTLALAAVRRWTPRRHPDDPLPSLPVRSA
ncbi:sodium:solute symporter [Thermobispora bispora]|uniref:Na+/solute symporter n=1 Tax=Thermobispora bispora (strain ATCC 19993 / DSM 43833 / CBS 139.67 / JCM 10125 / KCTC 9307 / NBRC 14880 / R51) TaxID=469371 RepID=D6YAR8_THEBD|nr:sodium:solute symporter [Thermobispora bispora]MBO2475400.1 sodium:solute symporter [Actinomycetales bacterium]MDI9581858.1 sodium:solute symporter [Thermobispora sp.]ADG88285.1 Na+/solute symporter [Thermobispora bispora DSM 43833]MBX6166657.1 sodium:solute symporter [Thermobispora bispora]QSI48110.1 sodium:solute symporter [Thermobispora bispora]